MYYGFSHRSIKMWERVFFHPLDLAHMNCHFLFKASTRSRVTQLEFRLFEARHLLDAYEWPHHHHQHPSAPEIPLRLTERAFSWSCFQIGRDRTVKSAVTGERGSITKRGIHVGASCGTHPCAYTPVVRGTTFLRTTK